MHALFHGDIVERLVQGAEQALLTAGIPQSNIRHFSAPGSFEIPLIGDALLKEDTVDALIGLGVIVEGETHHARLLAEAASRGIMDVQLRHSAPFAFEILYVKDIAQAQVRAQGDRNKGAEAALAVLHALAQLKAIRL